MSYVKKPIVDKSIPSAFGFSSEYLLEPVPSGSKDQMSDPIALADTKGVTNLHSSIGR